jgi:ketosteroid isomerase-like protein
VSRENVEVVRRFLEALARTESEDMPQLVATVWEPDGDYYPVRKFPEAQPCHGREEIARFFAAYGAVWDRFDLAINALTAVSDDRVLAHTTLSAEGRESGLKLEGDVYYCFWLRHGRCFRLEDHLTHEGALHALGLTGEAFEAVGLRG